MYVLVEELSEKNWFIDYWALIFLRNTHLMFDDQMYTTFNLLDDKAQLLIAAKIMLHICERSQEGLRLMNRWLQKHHQGSDCLKLHSIL